MLIDCPGCRKSYHIIKAALGPDGRRVACPRCDAIWFVPAEDAGAAAVAVSAADEDWPSLPHQTLALTDFAEVTEAERVTPRAAFPRRKPHGRGEWLAGFAGLALAMALIGWRVEMVRLWPRAASVYAALGLPVNLRGLALANFQTVTLNHGSQRVLGVEGEITNLRTQTTPLPPIRLVIRDAQGHSLYSWVVAAQKSGLAPGEKILFRARLSAPPADGRQVAVDFAPAPGTSFASLWRKAWRF